MAALAEFDTSVRETVLARAHELCGTVGQHKGRGPDCYDMAGVIIEALAAAGIAVDWPADYDIRDLGGPVARNALMRAGLRPIRMAEARPGDILCFRGKLWGEESKGDDQHFGILSEVTGAGLGKMIHAPVASYPRESWIMENGAYFPKCVGAWRLPEAGPGAEARVAAE